MVWEDRVSHEDPICGCSVCGVNLPRSEMFGADPDLLCPNCADAVRNRMQVRFRPIARERRPIVTIVSLAIAIALYICTHVIWPGVQRGGGPAWLAAFYQSSEIWIWEHWRHVTCMFLHGGWWHIGMNGMGLWYLGREVERGWGPWALLGLTLFTGVSASAISWIFSGSGVGISGYLFGLLGFLWALRRVHPIAAAVMTDQMLRWIGILLVIGVVLSLSNTVAIGNWAHGAGLATGYLAGLAVRHARRKLLVPLLAIIPILLVVASTYIVFGSVPLTTDEGKTFQERPRAEWRRIWMLQNGHKP